MKYDFDIKKASMELLPPDKRYESNKSLLWSLLKPLQWIRDLVFGSYYNGATAPAYTAGTYAYLAQVLYNRQVYMSLIDGNTDAPTTSNWMLIQDNFIGLKERILYNASKLVLEYALNKQYSTTFRQPPSTSDIYLTNLSAVVDGFVVGATEAHSSSVGQTTSSDVIGSNWTFIYLTHFQIHIPSALSCMTAQIRSYANQYVPASIKFTIVTY